MIKQRQIESKGSKMRYSRRLRRRRKKRGEKDKLRKRKKRRSVGWVDVVEGPASDTNDNIY